MSKIWPWQKPVDPTPEFIESESANAWSHGLAFLAVLISLPFFLFRSSMGKLQPISSHRCLRRLPFANAFILNALSWIQVYDSW